MLKRKEKIIRSQQRFKRDAHNVYTENVNKVALPYDDNKRLMSYDKVTTYPCGIKTGILIEKELLSNVSKKY